MRFCYSLGSLTKELISVKDYICQLFAQNVKLPLAEIFEHDLTLSEIIARSEQLQNSIDLMEAFAKISNTIKKQYGADIRLPAFSLDTKISTVLEVFLQEVDNVEISP
ncbi:hypothetical protein H6G76_36050 [Nostoc sp. FACHB-152]|nr:hypothetical protein [Nostoc sp. FACHB-152]MBD2473318.1 hypothetical protein [Nostoc sp. FACHB-145]